jgi:hypothetical protein
MSNGLASLVNLQVFSCFSPPFSRVKIIVKNGATPEVLQVLHCGAHAVTSWQ